MKIKIPYLVLAIGAFFSACLTVLLPSVSYILGHPISLFAQDRNYPWNVFICCLFSALFFLVAALIEYNPKEKVRKLLSLSLLTAIASFIFLSFVAFATFLFQHNLPFRPKLEYSFLQGNEIIATSLRSLRILQPVLTALLSFLGLGRATEILNPQGNPQLPIFYQESGISFFFSPLAAPWVILSLEGLLVLIAILFVINFLTLSRSSSTTRHAVSIIYAFCSFSILKNLINGTLLDPELVISVSVIALLLHAPLASYKKPIYGKIFIILFCFYALLTHWLFGFFSFFKTVSLLLLYLFFILADDALNRKKLFRLLGIGILFFIFLCFSAWGGGPSLVLSYDRSFFQKTAEKDKTFCLTSCDLFSGLRPLINTKGIKFYKVTSDQLSALQTAAKHRLNLRKFSYPVKIFGTNECNTKGHFLGNAFYASTGYLNLYVQHPLKVTGIRYRHLGWWATLKKDKKNNFDYAYSIATHQCICSFNDRLALFILRDILKTENFIIAHHENF